MNKGSMSTAMTQELIFTAATEYILTINLKFLDGFNNTHKNDNCIFVNTLFLFSYFKIRF